MQINEIGRRIAEEREKRGINQSELARRLGVSPQAVQKWESGGSKPRFDRLKEIADALGMLYSDLTVGTEFEVSPQVAVEESASKKKPYGRLGESVKRMMRGGRIPLISWVQAGDWTEMDPAVTFDDALDWIHCPFDHSESAFVLEIVGESNYNPAGPKSYAPGDFIAVDPLKEPINRSMVVVKLIDDNKATFKQLIIDPDGTKMLKALNPNWPKQFIEINGNAQIVGVAIGKWVPE